jgi:hypothetical protein
LYLSIIAITRFPRFAQSLMHTRCSFGRFITKLH